MPRLSSKDKRLEDLRTEMALAELPLKKTANHLVFGHGRSSADLMLIGEAPGRNEDLQGLPFVGAAGRLLDELLASVSVSRNEIYITSILKYRPPNNRHPSLEEIRAHTPYLVRQIETIEPKVLAPLGNFATRFVLSGFDLSKMAEVPGITGLRGQVKEVVLKRHRFKVVPLYHPAAGLYTRRLKEDMLKDFRKLLRVL